MAARAGTGPALATVVLAIAGCLEGAMAEPARAAPPPAPRPAPEEKLARAPAFQAIVLGASGGLDESDLSAVLLGPAGGPAGGPASADPPYLALDAGTLYAGLARAVKLGTFAGVKLPPATEVAPLTREAYVLRERIRAYCISHAHLDHVAGLVIASPEDTKKPIYGLAATLGALRAHIWNGVVWANFTTEGPGAIGRYSLEALAPGTPVLVPGTPFSVEAQPLHHGATVSTAFLVQLASEPNEPNGPNGPPAAALYLGDTGADSTEHATQLDALWRRVAPLIQRHVLRAIFIEVSYPDPRPEALLFGHLTPSLLRAELWALARYVDERAPARALTGLDIVITHIKPDAHGPHREEVRSQLRPLEAALGVRVIVPTAGARITF